MTADPDPIELLRWVRHDPHLLTVEGVRQHVPASLISYLLAQPSYYAAARQAFQFQLLRLTLEWAQQHCTFYREQIIPLENELTPDIWADFPTLNRGLAELRREDLLAQNTTFGIMSLTGGTTESSPLLIERSIEEQKYLQALFSILLLPFRSTQKEQPLGLRLSDAVNGSGLQLPSHGYSFIVDPERDYGRTRSEWLLRHRFSLRGYQPTISTISGSTYHLYRLCCFLEEQRFRPVKHQFQGIHGYGMPLAIRRRKRMEKFFGTRVMDVYSMAEIFGSAEYCHMCDAYHFSPYVIDEVLRVDSSSTVESGSGEMTLTTLFPFTQRFMLLRYRTGDLVSVDRVDCRRGRRAYRIRGRLKYAVCLDASRGLYIGHAEVAAALDTIRELNRERSGRDAEWPRFMIRPNPDYAGACLSVELSRDCSDETDSVRISRNVRRAVLNNTPAEVRKWLSSELSRLVITTHRPDTLKETVQQHL